MAFTDAVVKATGKKQRVPEHWLDHPTIGAQFRLPPSSSAKAEKPVATEVKASGKKASDS